MKLAALLFAVFFVGVIFGFAAGLFVIGSADEQRPARAVRPRKQPKQRPMAIDLNERGPRVLCEPAVFDSNDRGFLDRARDAGAL